MTDTEKHVILRLGTRASPLAMRQAEMTRAALVAAHGWPNEAVALVPMVATGDRIQDRALAEVGGKALWTKELDSALDNGLIDAAVHSMKDVETLRPDRFRLAAMLARADVRDRLVGAESVASLPQAARIGTSSPRRSAQLKHMRGDLEIVLLRGNVGTRLQKISDGAADATLLAAAGPDRLGMYDVGHAVPVAEMCPAPAQGAIGIEVRADDARAFELVGAISHPATFDCVMAERALLAALGADCRSPVAALATRDADGVMSLRAELYAEDGSARVADCWTIDSLHTAAALARALLERAPPDVRALFAP